MIHPVLLSGGAGVRLWPLSRKDLPKQFHALLGERSLLQETALRLTDAEFARPLVVANEAQRFIVAEQMRQIDVAPLAIMLEAVGRNTAPAAASAALYLQRTDPQAVMAVLPTDHDVKDVEGFRAALHRAGAAAMECELVTLGIPATRAETGFGYIQRGAPLADAAGCHRVARFVEKPAAADADAFAASGDYLWNSGVFVCRADRYLAALEGRYPEIVACCRSALDRAERDLDFLRLERAAYEDCEAISIDYAIMEQTEDAAVVPMNVGWHDVGSWAGLWELGQADANGNVIQGDVVALEVRNSYLRSEGPLVTALGLEDIVLVVSADAVLVCARDRAQDVRRIVIALEADDRTEAVSHRRAWRPWGYYETLQTGEGYQIKHLMVEAGAALSLQSHQHRAEHWVVVQGTALVTRGTEELQLQANESTYIPVGEVHRLENPGPDPLRVIEVQTGVYLGEDDIVRLEDRYGRNRP